jgi:hypothetical protein
MIFCSSVVISAEQNQPGFVPEVNLNCSSVHPITPMSRVKFEDQPWYPAWKKSIDRVVATRLALDATKPGTPEREVAEREYENALTVHRLLANQLR